MNYLKIARDSEHTVIVGGNGDDRLVEGCIVPRLVLTNDLVPQNVA